MAGCSIEGSKSKPSKVDSASARIELGQKLFFDPRLSRDFSLSCASCHKPELAFTDGEVRSKGFNGQSFMRNSPTLLNAGLHPYFMADGGAPTLELQAIHPIENEKEMNMPLDRLAYRLQRESELLPLFMKAWGKVDEQAITHSLAGFVRTLRSNSSKYDKFLIESDSSVFSGEERSGLKLFFGKANCGSCHKGPLLSDFAFYDVETGSAEDNGRERITSNRKDRNKFKTPILRNLSFTAPYMFDGRYQTLDKVVDHFVQHQKLQLNSGERQQLLSFLKTLDDPSVVKSLKFAGN